MNLSELKEKYEKVLQRNAEMEGEIALWRCSHIQVAEIALKYEKEIVRLLEFVGKCKEAINDMHEKHSKRPYYSDPHNNFNPLTDALRKIQDDLASLDQPAMVGEESPLSRAVRLARGSQEPTKEVIDLGNRVARALIDGQSATPSTEAGVCENCGTKLHPSSCHCCGHTVTSTEAVEQIDERAEFLAERREWQARVLLGEEK